MTSFLVTYGTGEGQTAKIARYIDSVLSDRGDDVTTLHVWDAPTVAVEDFDAVLIGSPVNNRRHLPEVVAFVEHNREALAARPTGFFQPSFVSILPYRWAQRGSMDHVDALVEATGWQPDRIGLFAGAVNYTQYDRVTRLLFRLVSAVTTGDTDTSRDYEYTDWDEVERFAVEFAAFVEERRRTARDRDSAIPGGRRGTAIALLGLFGLGLAAGAYWMARDRGPARRGTMRDPDPGRRTRKTTVVFDEPEGSERARPDAPHEEDGERSS